MSISALVPVSIVATEHGDVVLEVAFLMSAVDGHLADEEMSVFSELVTKVRGYEATKEEVGELLERFVFAAHTTGVPERVREVAKRLPPDLREVAFKVAVGLSIVDQDTSEHEDELVGILAAVLGLTDRVTALSAEAREAAKT